jgi:hypothetical protein
MIRFEPSDEPDDFDLRCRQRGLKWLVSHPEAERPYDYWSEFKFQLADAFRNLCAYTAVFEPMGTVDHFVSWQASRREQPELAYEWNNYRYASQWINSSKSSAGDILDPFEVGIDWFEISLPDLQLHATDKVPAEYQALVAHTLQRLPIVHDERILRVRRQWYQLYENNEMDLALLEKMAPLIAQAVRKRDALAGLSQQAK